MNRSLILILVCLLAISSNGCKKESSLPEKQQNTNDFNQSYQQWQQSKSEHDNSYTYTVWFESWARFGHTTTITVVKGKVTARNFEHYETDSGTGQKTIRGSWTEDINTLNTHNQGAEAVTLDKIYSDCGNNWLQVDNQQNNIYFEGNHNGIISICGYAYKTCQDGCFTGVRISHFAWLK